MGAILNYFHPLKVLERERKKYLQENVLPDFLMKLLQPPLPELSCECNKIDYLVLDLETTGLNPGRDRILSVGTIEITNFKMDMRSAETLFVSDAREVRAETAVINHIVPEMMQDGVSLDDAMESLFRKMQGKVLIAHGVFVEQGFLHHYLKQRYGLADIPLPWLDTLRLEKSMVMNQWKSDQDVTLSGTRARYGLPDYPAHEALIDAVATGELYLAQLKSVFGTGGSCFGKIYRRIYC